MRRAFCQLQCDGVPGSATQAAQQSHRREITPNQPSVQGRKGLMGTAEAAWQAGTGMLRHWRPEGAYVGGLGSLMGSITVGPLCRSTTNSFLPGAAAAEPISVIPHQPEWRRLDAAWNVTA